MNLDAAAFATTVLNAMAIELEADPTFVVPGRRYVAAGEPAFDCEELVVHGVRIFQAAAEETALTDIDAVFMVELGVTVARCAFPDDASPTTAQLQSFGITSVNDGAALLRAALRALYANRFGGVCNDVSVGPVLWAGPNGGLAGVTLTIQAQI